MDMRTCSLELGQVNDRDAVSRIREGSIRTTSNERMWDKLFVYVATLLSKTGKSCRHMSMCKSHSEFLFAMLGGFMDWDHSKVILETVASPRVDQ